MSFISVLPRIRITAGILLFTFSPAVTQAQSDVTVYTAKNIFTMERSLPEATAVAVSEGRIVSVGTLDTLSFYIDNGAEVDRQFEDKILMPGLIDPHVHPSLPAVLTQFPFLAPDDWKLPTGDFPGATTHEDYVRKLTALVEDYEANGDHTVPFLAWGYHPLWHGVVNRSLLNDLFGSTPVMVWHRSFHEIIGNDAALRMLGITQEDAQLYPHEASWEDGHFWENGAKVIIPKMPFLFAPDRYGKGMENFFDMAHQSGVTSIMDMGIGVFGDPVGETTLIRTVMSAKEPPLRLVLTPLITDFLARGKTPDEALAEIEDWGKLNSDRLLFDNHFKLMMDGAIFSGLSQYGFPGYKDGHIGQWMAPLRVTTEWARAFWNAGYQLHAHTNGDKSASALIDIVRALQDERPRVDHRTTLEHFAYATGDQLRQMSALGIIISGNPYYQYILADTYAENWLGEDVARHMVPLGSAVHHGNLVALHSDAPMAPLAPLKLVEAAVTRTTINGNQNAENEKLTVDQALRAITVDAAWVMRMENDIGSIRAGKMADFAILEKSPYEVDPQDIGEIPIWGTIFQGEIYPAR